MSVEETECELQQLVSSDEEANNLNNESVTPPGSNPVKPFTTDAVPKINTNSKMSSSKVTANTILVNSIYVYFIYRECIAFQVSSGENSAVEESSFSSRISRNVTSSSNISTHAFNLSSGRWCVVRVNDKLRL